MNATARRWKPEQIASKIAVAALNSRTVLRRRKLSGELAVAAAKVPAHHRKVTL
jgi:hypothetical protein